MPIQARTEFAAAINQIASEKGVEVEVIIEAIKSAALAAYRKDLSFRNEALPDDFDSLEAKIDPATGEITIFRGEENITPPGFARIAAQTAKQVITQKLHEAEKGAILDEYEQKVGNVISGAVQRKEGNTVFIDLGRAEGIMPPQEQIRDEFYAPTQRMKFLIKEIRESSRGPEVILSRADAELVKGLFSLEVPEIQSGAVVIKEIAREAGGRSKVAVLSTQDGVDPVGSLVGQKGVRVQAVINELGEEKIDIILYSEDPARFIAAALSPAKDVTVELNEEQKTAKVKVADSQLSLAIGKGGQNVRLAAKLTGWKIDIEGLGGGLDEEKKVLEENGFTADAKNSTEVVGDVEKNIDQVMEEESIDGAVVEEPTAEESAAAAAQAEADMQEMEMEEKKDATLDEGDGEAPAAEFEKLEEKRNEEKSDEPKEKAQE